MPPSPVSTLDKRHTGRLRKRNSLLVGCGWGEGGAPQECLVLYKAFNYLWVGPNETTEKSVGISKSLAQIVAILFVYGVPNQFLHCRCLWNAYILYVCL